jgi:hypothetical protein
VDSYGWGGFGTRFAGGLLRGLTGQGDKYAGVFTWLEALFRALCSLPCSVTVQTLFRRLADRIPGAMHTVVVPCQVTAEEAAKAIALKHRLALLTADPAIRPSENVAVIDGKLALAIIIRARNLRYWLNAVFPFIVW